MLVLKRTPNELWLVPTNGTPRKIDVDAREWNRGSFPITIHPDGRQIAYLAGGLANEVVVLENFLPLPVARR